MSHVAIDRAYRSVWWSIVVAPNWVAEEDEYCVSFTNPNGVGALQISAYKHESGDVPEDDLRDSRLGQFPEELTAEPVVCGAFSGVGVDYIAEGRFWMKRLVHKRGLLLFVTYNCNAADRELEVAETAQMLDSLQRSDA
jgi:hypothetical protein